MATAFWALIGVVGFAYVGYPFLLAVLVRLVGRPAQSADITPPVTLLVPAYNEEHSLGAKLESCMELDYPKDTLQILVLSDGSTDGTAAIAAQYAGRGVELMAFDENRGKLAVLHDGLAHARGEIVAFSDAASRLLPDSLRRLVRPFADPAVGCVSGVYRVLRPEAAALGQEEGFYWRYETFIKQCESDLASILGAHGSLYAIRRALCPDLAQIRINDDYEIPVKIVAGGHRAVYEPGAVACEEATEMGGFARRVRIALGNFRQLRLLGLLLWPPRPWLLFEFVAHKVLRLLGPACLLGALVLNVLLPGPVYACLLGAQILFYALALAGWLGGGRWLRVPVVKLPYYFCMVNAAYVVAFGRLVLGSGRVPWQEDCRLGREGVETEQSEIGNRKSEMPPLGKEPDVASVGDKVRSHFHETAGEFDSIYTGDKGPLARWLDRVFRWDMYERYKRTVAECGEPGLEVLDIGCGSGRFSVAVAKAGAREVLGLDFAEAMLGIAQQLAEKEGVADRCQFQTADFMEHDFGREFDVALAIGLFDYVVDPLPFLRKMRRLSRKKIVATFPLKWTWRAPVRKVRLALRGCPVYFFTKPQVEKLMADAGFGAATVERIGKIYFVVGHCPPGKDDA